YDKAIQLQPNHSTAYNNRGAAKHDLGDNQGAIADYKKAMSLAQQQGNTSTYDLAQNNLAGIS
ncbi:MAG: tetratricopeptide repeat protein, partial [Cyanobacteria bacterium J06553_1]